MSGGAGGPAGPGGAGDAAGAGGPAGVHAGDTGSGGPSEGDAGAGGPSGTVAAAGRAEARGPRSAGGRAEAHGPGSAGAGAGNGAATPAAPVLELRGVEAGYGPFRALFGVDLVVPAGGALALVGHNGAGKTTVARVATGLVRPTAGSVHVGGHDLTGARTFHFARAGALHVAEGRSVFAPLTVEENLLLTRRRRAERAAALERAYEVFPVLGRRRGQRAGTLSGGEQRMLSLATAIVEEPAVVVADELSLGLAPVVVDTVYEHLAAIRATGTALVVIEQKISHTLDLCDHVVVLRRGTVDWSGPTAEAGDVLAGVLGTTV